VVLVGLEAGKLAVAFVDVVARSQVDLVEVAGHTASAEEGIPLAGWPCLWVVVASDCVDVPQDGLVVGHPAAVAVRR
jgi:hypothetical protein